MLWSEKKKEKRIKFNPGLAVIGLQTTDYDYKNEIFSTPSSARI